MTLVSLDYGKVVMTVPNDIKHEFDNVPVETQVIIRHNDALFISGKWRVFVSRVTQDGVIIVLEHAFLSQLKLLEDTLDNRHLLRADRLRVLNLESPGDLKEIEHHFTDLSDFPTKVPCRINYGSTTIDASFNFESQSKDLSELNFTITDVPKFTANDSIQVEYTFLTVRYIIVANVLEFDFDFGVLVVKFPSWLTAITSRRYDRREANLSVQLKRVAEAEFAAGALVSCSVAGGTISLSNDYDLQIESEILLTVHGLNVTVPAIVKSIRKNVIGFAFHPELADRRDIQKIYGSTIVEPFVIRTSENYAAFEDLYREVGYGPKTPEQNDDWVEKTRKCWVYQDGQLPGNKLGATKNGVLTAAVGLLPMSDTISYGHSVAMVKSLDSIAHYLELAALNMAFTELFDTTYFMGSAKLTSHFSTRLYTIFEAHARPTSHQLVYSLGVYGPREANMPNVGSYAIEVCSSTEPTVPHRIKDFFNWYSRPHPSFAGVHEIRHFRVVNRGTGIVAAWIVGHSTPEYFTAANIFRIAFVFLGDDASVEQVYSAIQADDFFAELEINFISSDLKTIPSPPVTTRSKKEVFWFIFEKEEMGPVLASVSRAAWAVMRKYGDMPHEYVRKLMA